MSSHGDNGTSTNLDKKQDINYRLPSTVIPLHYAIGLTPHLVESDFTFDGESSIDLEIQTSTADVVLHSSNLAISEMELQSKDGELCIPAKYTHDDETQFLNIHFDKPLQPGFYTLNFKFTGVLNEGERGFNRRSYVDLNGDTVWLAVTTLAPFFAHHVFPCWDEPSFKATFAISVTHSNTYTALSNMPIHNQIAVDDDNARTNFQTTPLMSSDSISIIVFTNFNCISNSDGTINVWCRKHTNRTVEFILQVSEKATTELENYTGISLPVPKVDHVLVPDHFAMATGNWGLVIYEESETLFVEDEGDTFNERMTAKAVTRATSQQWFGNLVSPARWNCYWLKYGFVDYLQYYITDKIFKDWRIMDLFTVYIQATSFSEETNPYMLPIDINITTLPKYAENFCFVVYQRAAAVLRMVSHIVSENNFRAALQNYLRTHQYGVVTPDDLWQSLQNVLDCSNETYKCSNFKEAMDTWLTQIGIPLVTVSRDYATGEVSLYQQHFKSCNIYDDEDEDNDENDSETNEWWIPITYTTRTHLDFTRTSPINWLQPHHESMRIQEVDINDWIIVNIQQAGLYRVNYDVTNWKRIAEYLDSDEYTNIHVLNRAQIIDDVCHLVMSKKLSPISLLEITRYLTRETDYIPWYPAFRVLRIYEQYLKYPPSASFLKPYILRLMSNLIESVGFEERPDDDHVTKLKRVDALEWACDLGHSECRRIATNKLVAHLENPEEHKIPSNLEMWTFCCGMKKANEDICNKVLDMYIQRPSLPTLRYVGCSENPTFIEKVLSLTIMTESPIPKEEHTEVYRSVLYGSSLNVDTTMDFVISNWDQITHQIEDWEDIVDDLIGEIVSWEQLDKMKTFMTTHGLKGKRDINDAEKFLMKAEKYVSEIQKWILNDQLRNIL